ncbi:glycine betaine ABC transporter substrate-binding protein [Mycolicibacterium thermoresistibile]
MARVIASLGGLLLAVMLAGCGLQSSSGAVLKADPGSIGYYESLDGVPITVAAKDFTEQLILGNMISTVLATAGADVTNLSNTPGSFGVREALLQGRADIAPEYTGTGWINYLGHDEPIKDEREQWLAVKEADAVNNLTWLPPGPLNNTYAFAIREPAAQRLGVTKLSDLSRLDRQDLTFCVESEFVNRNDGLVPMLAAYGMTRDDLGRVTVLDTGVIYTATADGECNFGEVFTTDGRIPALGLRVLEDDREFFPKYNFTEVVNTDLLDAHPELAEIFAALNPLITNEVMLTLNAKVDNDGDDPALVARDWLIEQGLVS